ncbi:MAG TPA: Vms1/Ankzf1 family peptidyl-tRNA hydrolase [Caldilineaceae bacterium]|nr:Vms1/Ankzf1 family peptidyl-tRNA hydrolase [Caldilineaceae bacterium]
MFVDADVRQAIEFEADSQTPVLSIYLNVDPTRRSAEKYKLALRNLLNNAEGAASEDIKRMQNYLEMGYNRQGRGLVMFSCAARDFWWAKSYMVPVEDAVFVGRRPYVRQLARLMDTYERYGVIHVDQEGARLFLFNMGILEAAEGHLGEEVKLHKAGGWASQRYQRHEATVAHHNLQEAAELAEEFYRSADTRRLLLAGTEKNVARFKDLLSNRLRSMVVGRLSAGANATPAELSEKALKLAMQAAEQEANALADRVVTTVHKGGNAVAGLAETLTAVQDGRALHVVVLSGFARPAYRFVDSGYIVLDLGDDKELGSGRIQELPDAVESVLRRAMVQGIGVTILEQHAGLEKIGKIAALTRY